MTNPINHIVTKAYERRERYQHHYVDELPMLADLLETSIVGSFSVIKMETSQRLLRENRCIDIGEGMGETPSAIARDYLTLTYKRGQVLKREQMLDARGGSNPMPLYALPCNFEHGYYIDIRSCYWTLMSIVGWNVDYWPSRWLQPGKPPSDFPFVDHKIARNCLVSAGVLSDVILWNPRKGLEQIRRGNHLANSQLYRLINDILNAIADRMRGLGIVYINCDGYIAPDYQTMTKAIDWLTAWGLPIRIKAEGRGEVMGAGSYRVGKLRSRRVVRQPNPINNVFGVEYADWLLVRFARLARLARSCEV